MVKLTVRLGEPLLRLSTNPSSSLQNPGFWRVVLIYAVSALPPTSENNYEAFVEEVTHKLQVLSFYSRTLKRSALSFL